MNQAIRAFFRRMDAQDLVEYTLLLAFVGLVGISVFIGASGGIQGIWGSANTSLIAANTSATGDSASAPATGGSGSPTTGGSGSPTTGGSGSPTTGGSGGDGHGDGAGHGHGHGGGDGRGDGGGHGHGGGHDGHGR
jgi:Flp pilus assembly pilin Flp